MEAAAISRGLWGLVGLYNDAIEPCSCGIVTNSVQASHYTAATLQSTQHVREPAVCKNE